MTVIRLGNGQPFIPSLTDYDDVSAGWSECEYRNAEGKADRYMVGTWTGEPGRIRFDSWPYQEICLLRRGRIRIHEDDGQVHEFTAGDGFMVQVGTAAEWETVEASEKIFVAIDVPGHPGS